MIRLILICLSLFVLFGSGTWLDKQVNQSQEIQEVQEVQANIKMPNVPIDITSAIDTLSNSLDQIVSIFGQLNQLLEEVPVPLQDELKITEKPDLTAPTSQTFTIYNVKLGDEKEEVEHNLGPPKRSVMNEYGIEWHTYHENYHNFMMIGYDKQNKVAALYTNQDLIASSKEIKLGSPKASVREHLGDPLSRIQKGLMFYKLPNDRDYDLFLIDNSYVSVFYDKHENETVTAIQLINKELEKNKSDFYSDASPELMVGFEYLLFDLTNAARVVHNLPILTWDEPVKGTARKHSADMAKNNYFDHVNLAGQSPFDRMKEDNIVYSVAGENLAYGQFSSIFAHEGLMNSLGHRKNILHQDFKLLGVGVAFNAESQPYYTQKFYTKR